MKHFSYLVLLIATSRCLVTSEKQSKNLFQKDVIKTPPPRKLLVNTGNSNSGYYLNQLQQTHAVSNEAHMQELRQDELEVFDTNYRNIDYKIDEFRDGLAKKLMELKNSLERPKIPILGMGSMMTHPFTTPLSTSNLSKSKALDLLSRPPTFNSGQNQFENVMNSINKAQTSLASMANPEIAFQIGSKMHELSTTLPYSDNGHPEDLRLNNQPIVNHQNNIKKAVENDKPAPNLKQEGSMIEEAPKKEDVQTVGKIARMLKTKKSF